jgi:ketosteroid isomerase-like protein
VADGFPAGGRYAGRAAVFDNFFPASFTAWNTIAAQVDEVFAVEGNRVVVCGRYVGQTPDTETDFDVPFTHLWRVENERLAMMRRYIDTALIRDAIAGVLTR